jgi:hypothetical protein
MEVTFKLKDGVRVADASYEDAEAMGFIDGQKLEVVQTANGLALMNEEAAKQFRMVQRIMDENHEVLQRLAQ